MVDTAKYQEYRNGPLKAEVCQFLNDIRTKYRWTYKLVGEHLGISGGFAHRIMNKNGNITTAIPMPRIAEGIERLEAGHTELPEDIDDNADSDLLEHRFHLREGLQVAFSLPSDLTEREAERIGLFVRSLAH